VAHAADFDGAANGVQAKKQNGPPAPTNHPGQQAPGPSPMIRPTDMRVVYVAKYVQEDGDVLWTFMVQKVGTVTATGIKFEKVAIRKPMIGAGSNVSETEWETLPDFTPWSSLGRTLICSPTQALMACHAATGTVHMTNLDTNPANDTASSP
jgi:hypothetical protein